MTPSDPIRHALETIATGSPALHTHDSGEHRCAYCGDDSASACLQVDHITPVSAGGSDHPSNLVTACAVCNIGKGARALEA